jgi:hypothetical protein
MIKNLDELKEMVNEKIVLSEEDEMYYAVVVEENGDEFALTQSNDLDDLHDQIRNFGLLK